MPKTKTTKTTKKKRRVQKMNNTQKITKEPLFHIVKNNSIPTWLQWVIRVCAIILSLVIAGIVCSIFGKTSPFSIFGSMFQGAFGTSRRIWLLFQDTFLLLLVALALLPAFKMKFWNLGANGQILVSCIVCCACMKFMSAPDAVIVLVMIPLSIMAGIIWALIPAIFKAYFNTNESLFTLMLNYVAEGLVLYFINVWVKDGSAILRPIEKGNLPTLGNEYVLTILVSVIMLVIMFVYFRYTKHGYEISVVGESEKTAKYIGINVKKVVIRTLIFSGAICGIVGLLLAGGINHTMSSSSHNNMGFTAIMAAWLGQFNPFFVLGASFFITFVSKGMGQVRKDCHFTNSALSDVVIGIVYFFVIGCEFFLNYKIIFRKKHSETPKVESDATPETVEETPEVVEETPETTIDLSVEQQDSTQLQKEEVTK